MLRVLPLVYDQPFYKNNLSTSFYIIMGWMICLRVRLGVASNQVAGEESEPFLVFVGLSTDLASVDFHPSFYRPGTGLFILFASTLVTQLVT